MEKIDEVQVSRAILESYMADLSDYLATDVAIVGSGPAGLTAGYYLAKAGIKVAAFERKLSVGGGMWGGGAMFNKIVVQESGKEILDEFGIESQPYNDNYYVADSIESITSITLSAIRKGLKIFNLIHVEDLLLQKDEVAGLVIQWNPVRISGIHVDPIALRSKVTVDATGHDSEVVRNLQEKQGVQLNTETGQVMGEKPMWAAMGEKMVVEKTREVYPNLFVAGMCASAVFGTPRMGPIFGGMLASGKKVAELIESRLRHQ